LTGVTRFPRTSLFSALNNLIDLTLDKRYAAICGFTLEESDFLFSDHLEESLLEFQSAGHRPKEGTKTD
jgi:hypothetical protein